VGCGAWKVAVENPLSAKALRLFSVQALGSTGVEAAQDIALLRGMPTGNEEEVRNAVGALPRRVNRRDMLNWKRSKKK
jgi:hypothetical protein